LEVLKRKSANLGIFGRTSVNAAESYTTDPVSVSAGFEYFDYLGPIPEPTPLSLLLTVPVTFLPLMRRCG